MAYKGYKRVPTDKARQTCAGPRSRTLQLLPMDELRSRPCEVDGVPALFHRWIEEDRALLNTGAFVSPEHFRDITRAFRVDRVVPPGCSVDVLRETFALVEYRDGTIGKVKPELVRFLDKEDRV